MARYNLIIKDEVYVTLVQECMKQGKSMGKFLNEVLSTKANEIRGGLPRQEICIVCGKKALIVAFGKGDQKFFVCPDHKDKMQSLISGYREM